MQCTAIHLNSDSAAMQGTRDVYSGFHEKLQEPGRGWGLLRTRDRKFYVLVNTRTQKKTFNS